MPAHRIRLRGPWELHPANALAERAEPTEQVRLQTMPASWREAGFRDVPERIRCIRYFNRPTGLDESTVVILTLEGCRGRLSLRFNGEPLGEVEREQSAQWDITAKLRPRNEVEILIESTSLDDGLTGEVALEICESPR